MRRLLAVALVVGGLVALGAGATQAACPTGRTSADQQAKQAYAVFTGTVAGRHRTARRLALDIDVERIYKGQGLEGQVTVQTPTTAARCGVRVRGDSPYVFFVDRAGSRLVTDSRSGTAPATTAWVRRVEGLLGAGSSPTPPQPVQATFTRLAGETTSTARVIAPGVALVIVGLLGLVLVAAWGRRRA